MIFQHHAETLQVETQVAKVEAIDLSWLEWPDIDLSSIFDFFDFV